MVTLPYNSQLKDPRDYRTQRPRHNRGGTRPSGFALSHPLAPLLYHVKRIGVSSVDIEPDGAGHRPAFLLSSSGENISVTTRTPALEMGKLLGILNAI